MSWQNTNTNKKVITITKPLSEEKELIRLKQLLRTMTTRVEWLKTAFIRRKR